uniref:Uncharacterized protein n=1 Tax=Romanomermis culicivorax TaxID=13658 RepID=A0A915L5P8_ROMCU
MLTPPSNFHSKNAKEIFYGRFCECDNFNCPRSRRLICSGERMTMATASVVLVFAKSVGRDPPVISLTTKKTRIVILRNQCCVGFMISWQTNKLRGSSETFSCTCICSFLHPFLASKSIVAYH